jgi:hypothetical protein
VGKRRERGWAPVPRQPMAETVEGVAVMATGPADQGGSNGGGGGGWHRAESDT